MDGTASIEIFNSKLLSGSFEVRSDNKEIFLLKYNDLNYQVKNFLIEGNILEEQLSIEMDYCKKHLLGFSQLLVLCAHMDL